MGEEIQLGGSGSHGHQGQRQSSVSPRYGAENAGPDSYHRLLQLPRLILPSKNSDLCQGLSQLKAKHLRDVRTTVADSWTVPQPPSNDGVVFCPPIAVQDAAYIVGRSLIGPDKLLPFVESCNLMHEVWVPSSYMLEVGGGLVPPGQALLALTAASAVCCRLTVSLVCIGPTWQWYQE